MADIKIWDGTATWNTDETSENTPFGLYESDDIFTGSAVSTAKWCAKRLGYPVVDIELQSGSFYACFEEAITEYSAQVNRFNIKENLLFLKGNSTSSSYTHVNVTPNLGRNIQISKQYGSEAGVGGNVSYYPGSIDISSGSQTYDLDALWSEVSESGKNIEVKRVFYEASPAITRFFDPYVGTGTGTSQMLSSFGWQNNSPAVYYLMMPMYDDLLRMQAIEFNDVIRKSAYSFELINNNLRIFPNPTNTSPYKLYFQYILTEERNQPYADTYTSASAEISDFSNARYDNMTYNQINDPGKQWIRKYTLALTKELLGGIRSKYSSVPIPGSEITIDGDTLRTEAANEKEILISQLREDLEQSSRRNLLEKQKDESEFQRETINNVPLGIYIG